MSNFVKCKCQYCNQSIEFDRALIEVTGKSGDATMGQSATCPHCGMETILYVPGLGTPKSVEYYAEQLNKSAARAKSKNESRVENELDGAGRIFLILGVLGLLGAGYFAFRDGRDSNPLILVLGTVSAVQGAIFYLLFKGFAEVIRLLRKK
jgi:NAD-dependent SIR2 family protein deacetylase